MTAPDVKEVDIALGTPALSEPLAKNGWRRQPRRKEEHDGRRSPSVPLKVVSCQQKRRRGAANIGEEEGKKKEERGKGGSA